MATGSRSVAPVVAPYASGVTWIPCWTEAPVRARPGQLPGRGADRKRPVGEAEDRELDL